MKSSKLISLLIMMILTISANAQDKKLWKFDLGAGMSQNSGNVDNFSLKNTGEVQRNDSLISTDLNYKIVYQKEDETETNKGINAGLKFDLYQYNRWSPFIAAEVLSNKYKGYDLKTSALGGVKLRIYTKKDTCDYSLSAAFSYDNVDYTPEESLLDKKMVRLSVRPKIKQKLGEFCYLTHYTFYQPAINNFSDYIINSTTKFTTRITKKLSLDISFNYDYRSKLPAEDYEHYDLTTDVSLKISF